MKVIIKIFIISTVITLSQGCFVAYLNRIERQSVNVNLSAWTVAIVEQTSSGFEVLGNEFFDYGSIIHPQAVITLNPTILYESTSDYRIAAGCWAYKDFNDQNVDDCQLRNFSHIINGRIISKKFSNGNNSYAIIIVDSPFNLNERINVINLATNTMNNYSNCYLYAPAALSIINQNNQLNVNDQISLVTLVAPYKAEIENHSAKVCKYDGVNYTLIIEDTNLNFEKAAVLFLKENYRSSPLVCQKNNTNNYEQIGFFNIYLNTEKPLEQQRSELFINTYSVHEEIYEKLNNYFTLSEKLEIKATTNF